MKPADVGGVGHAALLRSAAQHAQPADQLKREPDSDRHISRDICEEAEQNYGHAPCRMKQDITTQHSGNRTRSSQTRNQQTTLLSAKCAVVNTWASDAMMPQTR